jgi:hypothetical protein
VSWAYNHVLQLPVQPVTVRAEARAAPGQPAAENNVRHAGKAMSNSCQCFGVRPRCREGPESDLETQDPRYGSGLMWVEHREEDAHDRP